MGGPAAGASGAWPPTPACGAPASAPPCSPAASTRVADAGGTELWCNARMAAVGFYRRAGFEVVSEEFDVPGIGAHVVMTRPVPE